MDTRQLARKRLLIVSMIILAMLVGAMSCYVGSGRTDRHGPAENPVTATFAASNLVSVRVQFVGIGIDSRDTLKERIDNPEIKHAKGESFDVPLDIWSNFDPIVHEAHFASKLSAEMQDYDDLLQISLETSNGELATIIASSPESVGEFWIR